MWVINLGRCEPASLARQDLVVRKGLPRCGASSHPVFSCVVKCLGVQYTVERLLDGAAHQLMQVVLDAALVDRRDIAQALLAIVFDGGGLLCGRLELRNSNLTTLATASSKVRKRIHVMAT